MKLEQQVCSLELAKTLKTLGVKQESYFVWATPAELSQPGYADTHHLILASAYDYSDAYAAFTVAELGEIASHWFRGNDFISTQFEDGEWGIEIQQMIGNELKPVVFTGNTEADARAQMVICLLENKLITL